MSYNHLTIRYNRRLNSPLSTAVITFTAVRERR